MTEDKLRALLEEAEEVGYARREWKEAEEVWEECKRHPYYEREMKTEEAYYREARSRLYAAAGIPEQEESRDG